MCGSVCAAAAVCSWLYSGVVAVSIRVCVLMDQYGNRSQQLSSCCGVTVCCGCIVNWPGPEGIKALAAAIEDGQCQALQHLEMYSE